MTLPICLECGTPILRSEEKFHVKKGYVWKLGKKVKARGYIHFTCPFGGITVEVEEDELE